MHIIASFKPSHILGRDCEDQTARWATAAVNPWSEVTALLEDIFIFFLALIQRKNVVEKDEWTPDLKEQQRRRWRIRTMEKCTLKDQCQGQQCGMSGGFPPVLSCVSCNTCGSCLLHSSYCELCFLKARTGFFWLGTTVYIAASHVYTSLFIANVRPIDSLDWINAITAGLVQAAGGGQPRLPRKRVAKESEVIYSVPNIYETCQ